VFRYSLPRNSGKKKFKIGIKELRNVAIIFSRFPKYRMPQNIISMINLHIPIFGLGILYDTNVVGNFVMARTILLMPITFFSQALGDVLYPKFCEKIKEKSDPSQLLYKSSIILLFISILISVVIMLFGESIFVTILGESWNESGNYSAYLILWFICNFINRPFLAIVSPLKLDKVLFYNSFITMLLICIGLFISHILEISVYNVLMIYSFASTIPQIIMLVYINKILIKHKNNLLYV
jgi:O-antigen/teichoic acid export membrane protein